MGQPSSFKKIESNIDFLLVTVIKIFDQYIGFSVSTLKNRNHLMGIYWQKARFYLFMLPVGRLEVRLYKYMSFFLEAAGHQQSSR